MRLGGRCGACSQLKSLISVSAPVTIKIRGLGEPRHGDIRLDPAALVQPLRVDASCPARTSMSFAQTRFSTRAASAPSSRNLANED